MCVNAHFAEHPRNSFRFDNDNVTIRIIGSILPPTREFKLKDEIEPLAESLGEREEFLPFRNYRERDIDSGLIRSCGRIGENDLKGARARRTNGQISFRSDLELEV